MDETFRNARERAECLEVLKVDLSLSLKENTTFIFDPNVHPKFFAHVNSTRGETWVWCEVLNPKNSGDWVPLEWANVVLCPRKARVVNWKGHAVAISNGSRSNLLSRCEQDGVDSVMDINLDPFDIVVSSVDPFERHRGLDPCHSMGGLVNIPHENAHVKYYFPPQSRTLLLMCFIKHPHEGEMSNVKQPPRTPESIVRYRESEERIIEVHPNGTMVLFRYREYPTAQWVVDFIYKT